MNWRGKYTTRGELGKWVRDVPMVPKGVPAVWVTFRFILYNGQVRQMSFWSLIDTGADHIVVPGHPLGVTVATSGAVSRIPGSIADRSVFRPFECRGVGGTSRGVLLRAQIVVDGHALPGIFDVGTCNAIDYPFLGLPVLNDFTCMLNPLAGKVCASSGYAAKALGHAYCASRWLP